MTRLVLPVFCKSFLVKLDFWLVKLLERLVTLNAVGLVLERAAERSKSLHLGREVTNFVRTMVVGGDTDALAQHGHVESLHIFITRQIFFCVDSILTLL